MAITVTVRSFLITVSVSDFQSSPTSEASSIEFAKIGLNRK